MKIIDNAKSYNSFYSEEISSVHFVIPIYKGPTYKSIHCDDISLLYVYSLSTSKEYMLCFEHSECRGMTKQYLKEFLNNAPTVFCYEKRKLIKYCDKNNLIDIDLVQWYYSNVILNQDYDTVTHEFYYRNFENLTEVNIIIPISKHYDKCKKIREAFFNVLDYFSGDTYATTNSYDYYNMMYMQLYEIEKNGLQVNHKLFNKHFETRIPKDDLVYTEYNMYTTTGRPSNRFNSINYAALNKEDGCRASFISRFKNGILVQFDYDAYHLRLLADLIDYKFPEDISVHEYLGKLYFDKQVLSNDEYQESKQISFKLLYGGITKDYLSIEFFEKVKQYTDLLFEKFTDEGYLESPIAGRKLHKAFFNDINPSKLLNYFIQIYETERNLYIISKINEHIRAKTCKLILYTYDSFLFDMDVYDTNLISEIQSILHQDNKFPTKLTKGTNYNDVE